MYRVVKSKFQEGYAIHKIAKIVKNEIYIEAEPLIKAKSMSELKKSCIAISSAINSPILDKANTIMLHKTQWNENDIPFYDDVVDDILEEEFMNEHTFSDEDKAHTRW